MPFAKGGPNPSKAWSERLSERLSTRKLGKAEASRKRYKKCREREVELGVIPDPETGDFRGPASDLEFAPPRRGCGSFHVEQLLARATSGRSQWMLSLEHGCSQATVSRLVRGIDQKTGNPVGRPMLTTRADRDLVRDLKDADPFGRHKDVAAAAEARGLRLTQRQVVRVLAYKHDANSGKYGRKQTNRYAYFDATVSDMHMGWREGLLNAIDKKEISMEDLVFQDEFPVYYGVAPRKGGNTRGVVFAEEHDKKGAGYLNVSATITSSGWVKVGVTPGTTDDATFVRYMTETQPKNIECDLRKRTTDMYESKNLGGPPLVDLIDEGKILLLDRLGRSGKSKDPSKLHYNKAVRKSVIDKGCGYELLPPKGAEFNPCELFNGHVQRAVRICIPEGGGLDQFGQVRRGPKNRREAIVALDAVLEELKSQPRLFRHWFHRRFTGSDATTRWMASTSAQEVRAAREAAGEAAMICDIKANAFRPELYNIHDEGEAAGPSEVRQPPPDLRVLAEVAAASEQPPLRASAPRDRAQRPLRARSQPRRYIEPINDEAPEESDEWQKPIPGVKQASVLSDSEDEE